MSTARGRRRRWWRDSRRRRSRPSLLCAQLAATLHVRRGVVTHAAHDGVVAVVGEEGGALHHLHQLPQLLVTAVLEVFEEADAVVDRKPAEAAPVAARQRDHLERE